MEHRRTFHSLHMFMFKQIVWAHCNVLNVTFLATPFNITEIMFNNFF